MEGIFVMDETRLMDAMFFLSVAAVFILRRMGIEPAADALVSVGMVSLAAALAVLLARRNDFVSEDAGNRRKVPLRAALPLQLACLVGAAAFGLLAGKMVVGFAEMVESPAEVAGVLSAFWFLWKYCGWAWKKERELMWKNASFWVRLAFRGANLILSIVVFLVGGLIGLAAGLVIQAILDVFENGLRISLGV